MIKEKVILSLQRRVDGNAICVKIHAVLASSRHFKFIHGSKATKNLHVLIDILFMRAIIVVLAVRHGNGDVVVCAFFL